MVDLEFPASAVYVNSIRLIIAGLARQQELNDESIYELKLAVSEVASTLIERNGSKNIHIRAGKKKNDLVITFNGIKNMDIKELLDSRLINKQKLELLVDNLSVLEEDNTIAITLFKRLDTS